MTVSAGVPGAVATVESTGTGATVGFAGVVGAASVGSGALVGSGVLVGSGSATFGRSSVVEMPYTHGSSGFRPIVSSRSPVSYPGRTRTKGTSVVSAETSRWPVNVAGPPALYDATGLPARSSGVTVQV